MIHIGPNGEGLDAITDPRDDVQVDPAAPAHVHASVQARVQRARDSFAWAQARADLAARNLAENLRTGFSRKSRFESMNIAGGDQAVVGAGPSLDLTWFTGARTVMMAGSVAPTALSRIVSSPCAVIAETLPIPYLDSIPAHVPIVCSVAAHPAVFARASFYYVRADSSFSRIARELNTQQIADGVNVVTTMLALSDASRVKRVSLYGVDLCTAPTGEVYAKGTPWGAATSSVLGMTMEVNGLPPEHNNPQVKKQTAIAAKNVAGLSVTTTPEWLEAKAWIEALARTSRMQIENFSGGLPLDLNPPRKMPSVPEPEWPTWTDDLALDLRIARDFEHRYPEVALFAANLRTRQPRTSNAIESLKDTMAIYQDAITRMRRGWEE